MNQFDQLIDEPKIETTELKKIQEILYRRSDLSTFIVHLTKDKEHLKGIIDSWTIEARNMWGAAKNKLEKRGEIIESQKCVCFTETPLEYICFMIDKIDETYFQRGPYGIAITKKLARKYQCNPIWYIDITPGHDWLINPVNDLINESIGSDSFTTSKIAQITPFIEQMGDNRKTGGSIKEFWWEREWRHAGNFNLPGHILLLCPESDFDGFEILAKMHDPNVKCVDPNWGLEKIIANLAGFKNDEIDIL